VKHEKSERESRRNICSSNAIRKKGIVGLSNNKKKKQEKKTTRKQQEKRDRRSDLFVYVANLDR
jgi:hypothetical protein